MGAMMQMIIHKFPNGDELHNFDNNISIPFKGARKVLSTVSHNGGYTEQLEVVFNHDSSFGVGAQSEMKATTIEEHQRVLMSELGFELDSTVGMQTGAHMKNAAVVEKTYEHLSVTAVATAGIEINGGRVGDPATWVEDGKVPHEFRVGTINIILYINGDMPQGAMARALVTCTEAKVVALQELQMASRYSRGLATGSGTDDTIIIADAESELYLTSAGKHSKLGELIGLAVIEAVKEALFLQTDVDSDLQHNAIRRLGRFGTSEREVYRYYMEEYKTNAKKLDISNFSNLLWTTIKSTNQVVLSSCLSHIMDQMDWNLLTIGETINACANLFKNYGKDNELEFNYELKPTDDVDSAIAEIISAWHEIIIAETIKSIDTI